MQQYWEIKSSHTDKIVLFRMGDFYEMFHADAEIAAPILNIALTSRNKKAQDETKMCGVPHHSIAGPIAKLLAAGLKVAICEQIEDPAQAKGIVKRAVTRVLSPGMVYDPDTLDQLQANYLAAFDETRLSFLEPTTGEYFFYRYGDESELFLLFSLLHPTELVLTPAQRARRDLPEWTAGVHLSVAAEGGTSFERIKSYAMQMQGAEIERTIKPLEERHFRRHLVLTPGVVRQLELLSTYRGERKGSLLHAIDRTRTASGARLLRNWLLFPLLNAELINERQEQIQFWMQNPGPLREVRDRLFKMGDPERRLGKLSSPSCNARDLLALCQSLQAGLDIVPFCPVQADQNETLKPLRGLASKLEAQLVDEPPVSVRQGGLFRKGCSRELDELIELSENSQGLLQQLEQRERESTRIPSLKIRFNNVFGYYIEITKAHAEKVPAHYNRKQTLANAERYTIPELADLEAKILSAESRRSQLEYEIFQALRSEILQNAIPIQHWIHRWSELDVLTGLAWLALERNYCRPKMSDGPLLIEAGRHPVVEQTVKGTFVANSVELTEGQCMLLTGPNMAGKSTIMRQTAVIVILAHMGAFVPAQSAQIPFFDRIFTRIGASDSLGEGLSTFMVEMQEAAEIVRLATPKSLIILDEIGRGTSTYDGMSLAQSLLEYVLNECKSRIMFATHYHELTHLAAKFLQIRNQHMAIREEKGEITFLHSLKAGPANRSYGIHVAKLAGLPPAITRRAQSLLESLETGIAGSSEQLTLIDQGQWSKPQTEIPGEIESLLDQVRSAPVQKMTPLEALNAIAEWQRHLS